MNLQYISDSTGKTTGVYIPISEWNALRDKYHGIDNEEMDIPEWQIKEVTSRLNEHKKNPGEAMDFESALNEIENNL